MKYKTVKKMKKVLSRAVAALMIVTCCMPITAFAGSEDVAAGSDVLSPVVVEQETTVNPPSAEISEEPVSAAKPDEPSAEKPDDAPDLTVSEENPVPEDSPENLEKPSEPEEPGLDMPLKPIVPDQSAGLPNTMLPSFGESAAITTLEIPIEEMPRLSKEIELKNKSVEFYNGGEPVEAGETIDPELPMELKINFEISNDILSDIHEDDTSTIDLQLGADSVLKLSSGGSAPVNLIVNQKPVRIGTLEIDANGLAVIQYNDAFQQEGNDFLELKGTFVLKLTLNSDEVGSGNENKIFQILGKEYTINLQPHPQVELSKEHSFDAKTGIIDWTLTVKPNKDVESYAGYVLTDTLPTDQVAYVENSCNVPVELGRVTFDEASGNLTVAFHDTAAADISEPMVISYQTQVLIPEGQMKEFTIENTAVMANEQTGDSTEDADTMVYTPNVITKSATKIKGGIEWKIAVNKEELSLKNAVITDVLDSNLALMDEEGSILLDGEQLSNSGVPRYDFRNQTMSVHLGDIDGTHTITIRTKLADEEFGKYVEQSIANTAVLSWSSLWNQDGAGRYAEGKCSVKVGNAVLTKSGGTYDPTTHQIPWSVKVDAENLSIKNAYLRDYFIYREDGNTIQDSSWNVEQALIKKLNLPDDAKSVAINQRFVEGSLTIDGDKIDSDNEAMEVHSTELTLKNKETVKVDIVTIHLGDLDHETAVVNFSSEVVKVHYGSNTVNNGNTIVANNRIYLFGNEDQMISAVCGWSRFTSWVLAKEAKAYNYADRTVDWGLHVNWNRMQIDNAVVRDILPEGFDIVQRDSGDENTWFTVYNGDAEYVWANKNGYVQKGDALSESEVSGLLSANVSDSGSRKEVTFTFNQEISEGSCYYIELHTKLTDEGAQKLFLEDGNVNKLISVANEASLTGDEIWGEVKSTASARIKNTIVSKYGSANPQNQSVNWTVDVNSSRVDLAMKSANQVTLVDQIPEYLQLMTKDGRPEATVYKLTLDENGAARQGDALSDEELLQYLTYDRSTRELRFVLPDSKESYRLQFDTVLIDTNVSQIVNSATLEGLKIDPPTSESTPIQIGEVLADISAQYAGKITVIVTETNKNDVLLPGAGLTLYKIGEDGAEEKIGDLKTSDANGRVTFTSLEPGRYVVRQTVVPDGYEASTVEQREVLIDTTTDNWGDRIKTVFFDNPKRQQGENNEPGQPGGSGGGTGNNNRPDRPQTPDMIIPENEVPAGPVEEVEIPDGEVPAGAVSENGELTIADQQVPGAQAANLPKTGGISPEVFYGLGILISAGGLWLRKRSAEKK